MNTKKQHTIKVQLPLASSDASGMDMALIYDENRHHSVQMRAPRWLIAKMKGRNKAFFLARWNHKITAWEIDTEVPDPGW